MKTCRRCNEAKPVNQFNRRSQSRDGRQSYCRDCDRDSGKAHYRQKIAANPDYNRGHYVQRKAAYLAKAAVKRAIDRGELSRQNRCTQCGAQGPTDFHHSSYKPAHWLRVRELCRPCHQSLHAALADQRSAAA